MKPLYTLVVLLFPFISIAQTPTSHNVDATDYMIFSPSDLTINLGDTVYFENLSSHNAVEVSEETYNSDGTASNGGFELYSDGYVVFEEVGTHYYVCTPHVQMGMKGTITVQGNPIQGQWYADIGDYVEITSNNFTIYIFDEEDCYELEEYTYELNGNSMTLFDDGFEINVEVLNITPNSFSLSGPDGIINLESASFDASEWVECDNESSWYCMDESCFEDMSGQGEFDSLEECEANCSGVVEDSWNCIEDACTDPMDGSGMYQSLEECEANCNATSINETNLDINIYPNPSSNIFNLELNTDSKSEIIVTNVLGEQVYIESTQSIGEFYTQIDLSNYSTGVYNLTIKTSYGISNHKLILQ